MCKITRIRTLYSPKGEGIVIVIFRNDDVIGKQYKYSTMRFANLLQQVSDIWPAWEYFTSENAVTLTKA